MILSGGGTAGHIYPALALADELLARDVDLLYVGTSTGPEARLVQGACIKFAAISTAGFVRVHPWTLITSTLKALKGTRQAVTLLRGQMTKGSAVAVVCFGGYVSIPMGLAARICKVPLIIHEQNSYMGMTNRFLARRACFIALTYPQTRAVPGLDTLCQKNDTHKMSADATSILDEKIAVVGNPVRASIMHGDAARIRKQLNIAQDARVLLVFGGSRGARAINRAIAANACTLLTALPDLHIIHSAGSLEYASVSDDIKKILGSNSDFASRYHLVDYIEDMGDVLAVVDLVVSRAGATSIAEITALGKPSVLVPYPFATDNHQDSNAQSLCDAGGARLITDDRLGSTDFADTLLELLADDQLRAAMSASAATLGKPDAASVLADIVMDKAKPIE